MLKQSYLLAGLSVVMLLSQSFVLNSNEKLQFRNQSWNLVGKEARTERKMIFVLVTADWCGACRKMEKVLNDGKVGKFYNSKFVNTCFDADNFRQQMRASNWGVTAVPALVFLDEKRNVIHKVQGYRNAAQMLTEANMAIEKLSPNSQARITAMRE